MAWKLHFQDAEHKNYRLIGEFSTKGNAKRKMLDLIDFRNEYYEAKGKGKMREEYDVFSNWSDAKRHEYWLTENVK